MIQIDQNKLIGKGSIRLVYLHPQNDQKVIKVYTPKGTPEQQRKQKWYKYLQSARAFDANARDLREHTKARNKGPELTPFICPIEGIVETDMGPGVISEHIRDENGQTSLVLSDYVSKNGLETVQAQFDLMFQLLARHHILFRDASANNIMVRIQNNEPQLVIIEGLGESNLIPYATVSRYLNARKLARKKQRTLKVLERISHGG